MHITLLSAKWRQIALFCFCALTTVQSQTLQSPIEFNGNYYAATPECLTWPQAYVHAKSQTIQNPQTGQILYGHLVTITSAEEQEFIYRTFVGREWTHAWIGAYRTTDDGNIDENWAWVTCETWDYSNWAQGQPQSYDEYRGSMMNYTNGTWHDYDDGYHECGLRWTIVEFETAQYECPEPFGPTFRSTGFEPPADKGTLDIRNNRTIPLRTTLVDSLGKELTADERINPPALRALYYPNGFGTTFSVVNAGWTFTGTGNKWHLTVDPGAAGWNPGLYALVMISLDTREYRIEPTCTLFVTIHERTDDKASGKGLGKSTGEVPAAMNAAVSPSSGNGYSVPGAYFSSGRNLMFGNPGNIRGETLFNITGRALRPGTRDFATRGNGIFVRE